MGLDYSWRVFGDLDRPRLVLGTARKDFRRSCLGRSQRGTGIGYRDRHGHLGHLKYHHGGPATGLSTGHLGHGGLFIGLGGTDDVRAHGEVGAQLQSGAQQHPGQLWPQQQKEHPGPGPDP